MKISIESISKSFQNNTIFNNLSIDIINNKPLAVNGKNGSGKSSFILLIAGIISPDEGIIKYTDDRGEFIEEDKWYKYVSISGPYLELIEEFSLQEIISFHSKFVPFIDGLNQSKVIDLLGFNKNKEKKIKDFSTGMKQKLKIALSLFFKNNVLLFDEPCANLDSESTQWYIEKVEHFLNNRILVVCSNNNQMETIMCKNSINIEDFKTNS